MQSLSITIQYLSLIGTFGFLWIIFRLIIKGKLREEYAIIWILCTGVLLLFSLWRTGLDTIAQVLGVFYSPSLIFLAAIFAIITFLVHLSVVVSKLQNQIKVLSQEIAYLKHQLAQASPTSI